MKVRHGVTDSIGGSEDGGWMDGWMGRIPTRAILSTSKILPKASQLQKNSRHSLSIQLFYGVVGRNIGMPKEGSS